MHSNTLTYVEKLMLLDTQMHLQFGKRIVNYADCTGLSEEVFQKTGKLVSSQTFRRFFNLIKSKTLISAATANIMSVYCGYLHLDHLASRHAESDKKNTTQFQEAQIYKTFFEVEVPRITKTELNKVYFDVINKMLKRVYDDKLLYDTLIPLVSENPSAHSYLFELFPFIDGFGRGFEQGYSLYLRHKRDTEAQVFGNAMLFLSAILRNDLPSGKMYYDQLSTFDIELLQHPFVTARYIGTKILFHHITGNLAEKQHWITVLSDRMQGDVNRHGFQNFSIEFQLIVAEYLLLCESYDLVIAILTPVYQNRELISDDMDNGFWLTPIKIMLIKSFSYTNRHKEARALMALVGPLNWLVHDYFSIHFLDAQCKLASDPGESFTLKRRLNRLILKTRFKYFAIPA